MLVALLYFIFLTITFKIVCPSEYFVYMDQIVVEAEYFNFLPSGGWTPDFVGIFFVDSNGKVSLNHEVLTLNSAEMSS